MPNTTTYEVIAGELRQEILDGALRDTLPAETALMERFGVARATLRQAIGLLGAEGLIESRQGRRTKIKRVPPLRRVCHDRSALDRDGLGSFFAEAEAGGWHPAVEVLEVGERAATGQVARSLGLDEGTNVFMRRRRLLADGFAMEVATSFFPWPLSTEAIAGLETGPGGIYERLADQGRQPVRFGDTVSAGLASESEARTLQIPLRSPVLVVQRVAFDSSDVAVELCDMVLVASRTVLNYRIS